ncbi:MAG: CheR family methyltransferase [Gammaproteobacteria bacterium]
MQSALVSPQLMTHLSRWIADRLGLNFPKERWGDLERNIAIAAQEFDYPSTESYITRLLSGPTSRNLIETLASYLTVGETYFFREPRSFEALETHVLPELLKVRRSQGKRLRIWSAGCCTGEEPYSIAILLDKLIPDYQSWNSTLLATDITPRFLRKAVDGIYGEWSFRGAPDWIRDHYFSKQNDGLYEINPWIRQRVTFSCLNLVDDNYPSILNNTNSMDIIFCRNVLMYFTEEQAKKVVHNLYRSLADGGWLITGSIEGPYNLFVPFAPVEFAGTILYQKRKALKQRMEYIGDSVCPFDIVPVNTATTSPPAMPDFERASQRDGYEASDQHTEFSLRARENANQGKLAEAAGWCEKAIALDKFNPGYRYLLATIQQEQGLNVEAVKSLKHALYLDPDFVLAYFALGNLHRLQGRLLEAEKYYINVQTILQTYPDAQILPESEGMTAARLSEVVSCLQSGLNHPKLPRHK